MAGIGDERLQWLAHDQAVVGWDHQLLVGADGVAVVAKHEELHPIGVVHALLTGCTEPEGCDHSVLLTNRLGGRVGVTLDRAGDDLAGNAFGDEVMGPLQERQRRDNRSDSIACLHLRRDVVELGDVCRREQINDGLALVDREQHDHVLAAEQALVVLVVLGDLRGGIDVTVLPRGKIQPLQAEPHPDRDEPDDRQCRCGTPAEQPAHLVPELDHGANTSRRRADTARAGRSARFRSSVISASIRCAIACTSGTAS